jgi:YHS domain-containing protein
MTTKQTQTTKRNIKHAQRAATRKRTIANLPESTRRELGKQAARGRARAGEAGHAIKDRNRHQLYELQVDPTQAADTSDYQGQTYYFCCPGCKETFDRDPGRYALAPTSQR